ncbi:hypothetical protein TKK_0000152 [Trichogramma kaykai]|uniref:Uncharacterized protein n=1 Tax=Trichogramma kaykai TaxID=54128 RepID=A0ABD2W1I0_9HYME
MPKRGSESRLELEQLKRRRMELEEKIREQENLTNRSDSSSEDDDSSDREDDRSENSSESSDHDDFVIVPNADTGQMKEKEEKKENVKDKLESTEKPLMSELKAALGDDPTETKAVKAAIHSDLIKNLRFYTRKGLPEKEKDELTSK